MKVATYIDLKARIIEKGFSKEVEWAENLKPIRNPLFFWLEYVHVVVNSGMKAQIAKTIFNRITSAKADGIPTWKVFKHRGKVQAIEEVWEHAHEYFYWYYRADDKLSYLETLPWIGKITKFHLGRNLGLDVCKPDRHLTRIAEGYGLTPAEMCERLSIETGDRIGAVDAVIWRAANLGLI